MDGERYPTNDDIFKPDRFVGGDGNIVLDYGRQSSP